jgi:hypothetical protein
MGYTIQYFWEGEPSETLAPFLLPLTLTMPLDAIRDAALKTVARDDFPAHSFTIESTDGTLSERWFYLDGKWRRKDA